MHNFRTADSVNSYTLIATHYPSAIFKIGEFFVFMPSATAQVNWSVLSNGNGLGRFTVRGEKATGRSEEGNLGK